MKGLLFFWILLLSLGCSFGQSQRQNELDAKGQKTTCIGITTNQQSSTIGGLMVKKMWGQGKGKSYLLDFSLTNFKHRKEFTKPNSVTNRTFKVNKLNYLFQARAGVGMDVLLFRKLEQDGLRVSVLGASGPVIGITKPYYVYYDYESNGFITPRLARFDPAVHEYSKISGSGPFLTGFDELRFIPGWYGKLGIDAEFSAYTNKLVGLEVGMLLDYYFRKVDVIHNTEPVKAPFALYASVYFGFTR